MRCGRLPHRERGLFTQPQRRNTPSLDVILHVLAVGKHETGQAATWDEGGVLDQLSCFSERRNPAMERPTQQLEFGTLKRTP